MLVRGDKRKGSINGSYSFGVCRGGVGEDWVGGGDSH